MLIHFNPIFCFVYLENLLWIFAFPFRSSGKLEVIRESELVIFPHNEKMLRNIELHSVNTSE